MPQTSAISQQWVTCPGCNKTSLRSIEDHHVLVCTKRLPEPDVSWSDSERDGMDFSGAFATHVGIFGVSTMVV